MNTVLLNTISLDDGRIIKKGGSGGGGNTPGGGGSDMPVIGDGKTYLYIKIAEKGRMNVPLNFYQSNGNGVTVDWGDGSKPQKWSSAGYVKTTHTYADKGEYVISLSPVDGCTLWFGSGSFNTTIMGDTSSQKVYINMLQAVEIGKNVTQLYKNSFKYAASLKSIVIPNNVTSIGQNAFLSFTSLESAIIPNSVISLDTSAFYNCYGLKNITIPNSVTEIPDEFFYGCYSLSKVVLPNSIKSIGERAFESCYSLSSITIPNSVTSIFNYAFSYCNGMAFYDFSQCTSIPTLGGTSVFSSIPSDCKIVVPDALYDSWIGATNWSKIASNIIKASEFNA
jgi:hypothetical protein